MFPLWQKIVAGAGGVARSASSDTDELDDVAEDATGGDTNGLLSTEEYREFAAIICSWVVLRLSAVGTYNPTQCITFFLIHQ